jgi:hypothetical protein
MNAAKAKIMPTPNIARDRIVFMLDFHTVRRQATRFIEIIKIN